MGIQTDPELTEWSSGRHFEFGLSPITRLLLDVFARNLAGGLNYTSYIELYRNIKQKNIQYGDDRHFVFLHET